MNESALRAQQTTLWDPSFESDACGMGFVAQLDAEASHTLIDYALTMLTRMNHRGGTGAEPDTGDGAGMLLALPDEFFQVKAKEAGYDLPKKGDYAVAQLFLPQDTEAKDSLLEAVKAEIKSAGFHVLMTRDVPFNYDNCGPAAQEIMPSFVQVLLKNLMILKMVVILKTNCSACVVNLKRAFHLMNSSSVLFQVKQLCIKECFTLSK